LKLLVSLVLALALPAAAQEVLDVERAEIFVVDGGWVSVDGGTWLSTGQTMRTAAELVDLRTQNASFVAKPPVQADLKWLGVGVALGLALGVAASVAVAVSLTPR
jgi:hypothetical protein